MPRMDRMGMPDAWALAQDRARCFSYSIGATSIRYVTVFGSLLAVALACVLTSRVEAAPVVDARQRAEFESGVGLVGALSARDAAVARGQSGGGLVLGDRTIAADTFDAQSAGERSLLHDGIVADERHAGTTRHALLVVLLTLAGLTAISFCGWYRTRIALKRAAEKLRGVESEWRRKCIAIEHPQPSEAQTRSDIQAPRQARSAQAARRPVDPFAEPFELSYLDALSNEGIDLHTFVRGWRQSMGDDLERMRELHRRHDVGGIRESLHRLSGAVGLVGARSLMGALRDASVAQPEPGAGVIEALAERIESLMMQLDEAIDLHGSRRP